MANFEFGKYEVEEENYSLIPERYLFEILSEVEQKKELIRLGIYIQAYHIYILKRSSTYPYFNPNSIYAKSDKVEKKFKLLDEFVLDYKYYMFNPKILSDIFRLSKDYVDYMSVFFLDKFKEKTAHLASFTNDYGEKIIFLKESKKSFLNDYMKIMEGYEELIISLKNPERYGYKTLKECVISLFYDNDKDIIDFLFGVDECRLTFTELWLEIRTLELQMDYCNHEISKHDNSNSSPNFSKLIFKEDGEDILSFITNKYPKDKNTAFFSYLYFFLQDKNKLELKGKDSIDYKNYILKKFSLKSFKRIQNTDSKNQYTKEDNFNLFNKYLTEYYSIQNEEYLSKNE